MLYICARVECEFVLAKLFLCSFRECVNIRKGVNYHVNTKSLDTFIKRSQNIKSLPSFLYKNGPFALHRKQTKVICRNEEN